ncbi:hypothetical protein Dimus_030128 [Dionaea muscipula]
MTVTHLKKKDVVKSSVKGVVIEFDHDKLASILGVPGNNGIYEYIKDVWEESKYTKPLEITRRFSNDETLTTARIVIRRDDENVPEEEAQEEEGNQAEFDWEAVVDEAAEQGESGSDDQFYNAQVEVEEPVPETPAAPAVPTPSTIQQRVTESSGVDPSCPSGHIPESVMNKLQADFKRARADRIQADLEKAQAEYARLLALLQQAQSKPKP